MRTMNYKQGGETQSKIDTLQKLINNPEVSEKDKINFRNALKQFQDKLALEKNETARPKVTTTARPKVTTTARPKATTTARPKATTTARPKVTTTARPKVTTTARPKVTTTARPKVTTTARPKVTTTARPKATTTARPKATIKKIPKGVQLISKKRVVVNGLEMNTDSQEFCDFLTAEFIKRKEQAKKNKVSRKKTKSVMEQVSTKIEQGVQKAIKTGIEKQKPSIKKNPSVFIGKVQKLENATKNFLIQLKDVLGNDYDAQEVKATTNAIQKLIDELKKKYAKK